MSKRATVKDVKDGVRIGEFKLTQSTYCEKGKRYCGGCVFTALYCKANKLSLKEYFRGIVYGTEKYWKLEGELSSKISKWARKVYGRVYSSVLISTFDSENNNYLYHGTRRQKEACKDALEIIKECM